MADNLGTAGGVASAHEAQPVTDGVPTSVAITKAPPGQIVWGFHTPGIGGSGSPAH